MLTDEQEERLGRVWHSCLGDAFERDALVHVVLKRWVLLGGSWTETLEALSFALIQRTTNAPLSSEPGTVAGVCSCDSAPAPKLNGRGKMNGSSAAAGGELSGEGTEAPRDDGTEGLIGLIILAAAAVMGAMIGYAIGGLSIGRVVIAGGIHAAVMSGWVAIVMTIRTWPRRRSRRRKGAHHVD